MASFILHYFIIALIDGCFKKECSVFFSLIFDVLNFAFSFFLFCHLLIFINFFILEKYLLQYFLGILFYVGTYGQSLLS